jgi:hypothetical protein
MNKNFFDKQIVGFISGIIGPVIGGILFYFMQFSEITFRNYLENAIKADIQSELISLSTVFNLLVFFIFIWLNLQKAARGVILATFIYVLIVMILKFS